MMLREYQQRAVEAAAHSPRALTVMACGTGKTAVAIASATRDWTPETTIVIFTPTLALLEQTYQQWLSHAPSPFRALAVCSRSPRSAEDINLDDVSAPTTTDPADVASWLDADSTAPRVVFATYQSADVVTAAHEHHGAAPWTIMVCDEAHRTAGRKDSAFAAVLHDNTIPAARRLFFTATPKIYSRRDDHSPAASMDDTSLYGPTTFTLTTQEAIDAGYLSDYRLAVIAVTDEQVRDTLNVLSHVTVGGEPVTPHHAASLIALHHAVRTYGLRSILAFHNTVASSKAFTAALTPVHTALHPTGDTAARAVHVDGASPAHRRRHALTQLTESTSPGQPWTVVSNARCFTEGIDVPALDAVMFVDARSSAIDVTQAVGRAIRKNPHHDEPALIILAVTVHPDEDPEQIIANSDFDRTRRVIAALASHDPSITTSLARLRTAPYRYRERDQTTSEPITDGHIDLHAPLDSRYLEAFTTRVLPRLLSGDQAWEEGALHLRAYSHTHGHVNVPATYTTTTGYALGQWVSTQRRAAKTGALPDEQRHTLDALGFIWDAYTTRWNTGYEKLAAWHDEHGHCRVPKNTVIDGYRLGIWVQTQRTHANTGTLASWRHDRLDHLNFTWDPHNADWDEQFQRVQDHYYAHGQLPRPHDDNDSDTLGWWLARQQRLQRSGHLTADRTERLHTLLAEPHP